MRPITQCILPSPGKHIAAVVASLLLCATSAQAADEKVDHLEPQISAMDLQAGNDYYGIVHAIFREAWNSDFLARRYRWSVGPAVTSSDDLVALRRTKAGYSIVHLHDPGLAMQYSSAGRVMQARFHDKPMVPDYHAIKPDRCEIAIPSPLALRIREAWHVVLAATRYYEHPRGPPPDGGWTQFSMDYNGQNQSGEISDAVESGSAPAMLMAISADMQELCDKRYAADRTALEKDVGEFFHRFGGNKP